MVQTEERLQRNQLSALTLFLLCPGQVAASDPEGPPIWTCLNTSSLMTLDSLQKSSSVTIAIAKSESWPGPGNMRHRPKGIDEGGETG